MSEQTRVIGQPIRRDVPEIPVRSTGPGPSIRGPVKEGQPAPQPASTPRR